MANFEVFCWVISSSINLLFLKSAEVTMREGLHAVGFADQFAGTVKNLQILKITFLVCSKSAHFLQIPNFLTAFSLCSLQIMWRVSPCGSLFLILQSLFLKCFCTTYLLLTYFEYIRKSRLEKLYQVRYMSL